MVPTKCPKCGQVFSIDENKCPSCGTPFSLVPVPDRLGEIIITILIAVAFQIFLWILIGVNLKSAANRNEFLSFARSMSIGLAVLFLVIILILKIIENNDRSKAKELEKQLKEAIKIWYNRMIELHVSTTNPVIWKAFANGENRFYAVYIWREGEKLCQFLAQPTLNTMHFEAFMYPERLNISRNELINCYRTGSQGVRVERDFSEAEAKANLSKYQSGLQGVATAYSALKAAQLAPTVKTEYDTRRTVVEYPYGAKELFRIDAYDTLKKMFPYKC